MHSAHDDAHALAGARRCRQACPPSEFAAPVAWPDCRRAERIRRGGGRAAAGLWRRDPSVWSGDPACTESIANRLGWLSSPRADGRLDRSPARRSPSASKPTASPTSCCSAWADRAWRPKCCARSSAWRTGWPRFHMLDSTDPAAVRAVAHAARADAVSPREQVGHDDRAELARRAFPAAARDAGVPRWADHFVAITDAAPSSSHARAPSSSATSSSTRPTSAAATRRCRSSGWCRRR